MSKESKAKPREFWIAPTLIDNDCRYNYVDDKNSIDCIHVIEYSALLEERAKSARLLEALESIRNLALGAFDMPKTKFNAYCTSQSFEYASKAIADYNQSEGGG